MENIKNIIIISIVCGSVLLVYKYLDPNKDVERFYHSHNKGLYYLHVFAYTILMLSFVTNLRVVVISIYKKVKFM